MMCSRYIVKYPPVFFKLWLPIRIILSLRRESAGVPRYRYFVIMNLYSS